MPCGYCVTPIFVRLLKASVEVETHMLCSANIVLCCRPVLCHAVSCCAVQTVALSNVTILAGAITNAMFNMPRKNPFKPGPIIDYDLLLLVWWLTGWLGVGWVLLCTDLLMRMSSCRVVSSTPPRASVLVAFLQSH